MNYKQKIRSYIQEKIYDPNTNYILSIFLLSLINIWQSLKLIYVVVFSTLNNPYAKTRYIIPDSCNIVYINVPKAGCSSIRKALLHCDLPIEKIIDVPDDQSIHKTSVEYNDLRKVDSNSFVFTFVRNPFERLVSLYLNKFRSSTTLNRDGFLYNRYLGGILTIDMTFSEFVKTISRIPDRISETHFKSQYSIIYSQLSDVNFIGKFEDLNDGFETIRNKFPEICKLPHFNKTTDKYDYRDFYTKELIEIVTQRYANDVKFFNYKNIENELLDYISAIEN